MSNTTTVKSGAWYHDPGRCRSACRHDRHPSDRFGNLSFRLGLDPVQLSQAIRGGTWIDSKRLARSAHRYFRYREGRYSSTGIRLALDSAPLQRIVKSGSWLSGGRRVRSAHRSHRQPCFRRLGGIGLRLALTTGPVQPRRLTTVAGGAWYDDTDVCRSAYRYYRHPSANYDNLGLHLGLDTVQPDRTIKSGSWFSLGRQIRSAHRDLDEPDLRSCLVSLRLALTTGPAQLKRTMRGGGWNDGSVYCRSAYRNNWNPTNRDYNLSLRLALTTSI